MGGNFRSRARRLTWAGLGTIFVASALVAVGNPPAGASSAAAAAGTGRVIAEPCLNMRTEPKSSAKALACIPYNKTIKISCTATGSKMTGPYGATTLWDKTTWDGKSGYVTDAFVYTGKSGPVAGKCSAPPAPQGGTPTFQLPFVKGQSWKAGAPHSFNASSGTKGSVDFGPNGGSANVVAIAAGTVYKVTCGSAFYLGVDHGGGWRSTYYHLTSLQTQLVGKKVAAGTYLGKAGLAAPCGGSANGFTHVHLSILKNGSPANLNGMRFGGYRVYATGGQYQGYWNTTDGKRALSIGADGFARCCLKSS